MHKLGEFEKYEMFYEPQDVILFNSRLLKRSVTDEIEREKGIMSNLYDCNIPFDGIIFNSTEQLLYYIYWKKWGNIVGFDKEEVNSRIKYILSLKKGSAVKNQPYSSYGFSKIYNAVKKHLGKKDSYFEDWKVIYFMIRLKYKYCEEFRNVLEKYKDKILCEDSDWNTSVDNFNGVYYDEELGKYRGVNALGRVMKMVYLEREMIMGES